jgi:hypothetical protein
VQLALLVQPAQLVLVLQDQQDHKDQQVQVEDPLVLLAQQDQQVHKALPEPQVLVHKDHKDRLVDHKDHKDHKAQAEPLVPVDRLVDHKDHKDHKDPEVPQVLQVLLDHKVPQAQVEDPLVPLVLLDHKAQAEPQELDPLVLQEQLVLQDHKDHKD